MKMKFIFLVLFVLILGLGIFPINSSQQLNIVGSSSVQPICEDLVGEYKKTNRNIDINVQGGGSSLGIRCANNSYADIGMSSMDVVNDSNLKAYELGIESIAVVINPENPIGDLSSNQIREIFSGNITDWCEISNRSGKINVIVREEGSGTLDTFKDTIMKGHQIKKDAIIQNSPGGVKQSIIQDKNAIGFVSLSHLGCGLKNVSIGGVCPSQENIVSGEYVLQRPFLLLTNSTPDCETREFINWAVSDDASKFLKDEKIY